jgi:hypothetical protein
MLQVGDIFEVSGVIVPIGLLLFYDELLAWINGFNQYKTKGNDHQKFR